MLSIKLRRNLMEKCGILFLLILACFFITCKSDADSESSDKKSGDNAQLSEFFKERLTNISKGIDENEVLLDGLEKDIETAKENNKDEEVLSTISAINGKWSVLFNDNNNIQTLANQAKKEGSEEKLQQAQEELKEMEDRISELDQEVFKLFAGTSLARSKTEAPKEEESTDNTASNAVASTSNDPPSSSNSGTSTTTSGKKTAPNYGAPSYDMALSQRVLKQTNRHKDNLTAAISAARKRIVQAGNSFGSERQALEGNIKQAEAALDETLYTISTADKNENIELLSMAMEDNDKLRNHIRNIQAKTENLVAQVEGGQGSQGDDRQVVPPKGKDKDKAKNKNIAKAEKMLKEVNQSNRKVNDLQSKLTEVNAHKKMTGELKSQLRGMDGELQKIGALHQEAGRVLNGVVYSGDDSKMQEYKFDGKQIGQRLGKLEAIIGKVEKELATMAEKPEKKAGYNHPIDVIRGISKQTISEFMELSPSNRNRATKDKLETRFVDASADRIVVMDENNSRKNYSLKEYVQRMFISGPYYITMEDIELDENKKIVKLVLKDTKISK